MAQHTAPVSAIALCDAKHTGPLVPEALCKTNPRSGPGMKPSSLLGPGQLKRKQCLSWEVQIFV